jgi:hypothetical protein
MNKPAFTTVSVSAAREKTARQQFFELFERCPIPDNELLGNLGLFINRQALSRMLYMHDLYRKIINTQGIIMEFGPRWGQNLALFHSFRGIYEPYNYSRKIVGFDTFQGFLGVSDQDGKGAAAIAGGYGVAEGYESYLDDVLQYHEQESPLSHIRRFELRKGDASLTLAAYLQENPETIIAFAYFDMDLYEPTKKCLELVMNHVTRGSILGFDELNYHHFPGETSAFREVLGLTRYRIERSSLDPLSSYLVIE